MVNTLKNKKVDAIQATGGRESWKTPQLNLPDHIQLNFTISRWLTASLYNSHPWTSWDRHNTTSAYLSSCAGPDRVFPPRCPATLQVVLLFLSLFNSQVPLFLHSLPVPLLCRGSVHQHLMRLCPNLLACLFPLAHRFQLFTPCRLRHHFTISSFSSVLFSIAFHFRWNASFYSGFLCQAHWLGLFVKMYSSGPALYPGIFVWSSSCFVHLPSTPSTRPSWRLAS